MTFIHIASNRITPAYAGNTPCNNFFPIIFEDHPRLRGEHLIPPKSVSPTAGSPPPTRGTPLVTVAPMPATGITPAYAGNTSNKYISSSYTWDHPRLRGEHLLLLLIQQPVLGSPPPTRGTQ